MRFMWKFCATWIECVVYGVVQKISNVGRVHIRKASQSPCEVSGIVVSSEYASKSGIEERLRVISAKYKVIY